MMICKRVDHLGYFCPHCYCGIVVKDNLHIPPYYIECPRCHKTFIWEKTALDANITACVATLNLKGWRTLKSSEGREGVEDAYVVFEYFDHHTVLIDYPLVGPWFRDEQSDKLFIIRASALTFSLYDRIDTLAQWVNSLPFIYDTYYRPKPRHIHP